MIIIHVLREGRLLTRILHRVYVVNVLAVLMNYGLTARYSFMVSSYLYVCVFIRLRSGFDVLNSKHAPSLVTDGPQFQVAYKRLQKKKIRHAHSNTL